MANNIFDNEMDCFLFINSCYAIVPISWADAKHQIEIHFLGYSDGIEIVSVVLLYKCLANFVIDGMTIAM